MFLMTVGWTEMIDLDEKERGPEYKFLGDVGEYVKAIGGDVVVAGGISIQYDPTSKYRFKVTVDCTGKPPKMPDADEQSHD